MPGAEVVQLPSDSSSTLIVAGEHAYVPGQFLAAAPEAGAAEGFLLKVVGSQIVAGETEVQTEPGSLYEAVPNGELVADLEDLGSATPQNADARKISGAIAMAASPARPSVPFSRKVQCKGKGELTLSGSLTTSIAPHVSLEWHTWAGIPVAVDRARATLDTSIEAEARGAVSDEGSCELSPITLLTPEWEILARIPGVPVPVPITVEAPIELSGSATVHGSIEVKAAAEATGTVGVAYEDEELSGIHELSSDADLDRSVNAGASLQARIGPNTTISAGWKVPYLGQIAARFGVKATTGLDLDYDTSRTPPWKLCAPIDLAGSIALILPKFKTIQKQGPLYHGNIRCIKWGSGLRWTGTVSYASHALVSEPAGSEESEASIDWLVNAAVSPEGTNGENGQFRNLGYKASWTAHATYLGNQCGNGATWTGFFDGSGSGEVGDHSYGPEQLQLVIYPNDYEFRMGVPGTETTQSSTNCEGLVNEFEATVPGLGVLAGVTQCVGRAGAPLPRSGMRVVGELSDAGACNNEVESIEAKVEYDLTVTCADGSAPDSKWECSEP